jgi:hypothetical protein
MGQIMAKNFRSISTSSGREGLWGVGGMRNNLMPKPRKIVVRDGYEWELHPSKGWRRGARAGLSEALKEALQQDAADHMAEEAERLGIKTDWN